MGKVITAQELSDLRDQGATVEREPREILAPLLEGALEALTSAVDAKSNEAVVSAIRALTEAVKASKVQPISIEPLIAALKEHTTATQNRPSYTFTMARDSRGRLSSFKATPS